MPSDIAMPGLPITQPALHTLITAYKLYVAYYHITETTELFYAI